MKTSIRNVVVLTALWLVSMSVQAGPLAAYLPGDTVVYEDISENISGAGTYGTPTVSGDILDFNPSGLKASATGGAIDFNDAFLSFDIKAKDGFAISDVLLSEAGDSLLLGTGTAATYTEVTATYFVDIHEIDGVAPIAPINFSTIQTFANFELPADSGVKLWSGNIDLDLDAILLAAGQPSLLPGGGATWVSITLDNFMIATSEAGTTSQITKKDLDGFSVTSVVIPEPASVVLLLGTTTSLIFFRRRVIG